MSAKRFRLMYKFWLDQEKADEAALADQIEILKNERSFAKVIRDGIRLVIDLRRGKLDVLFELFPWVRAEFLEYMRSLQPPADNQNVAVQLARLEKLLLEQGNVPTKYASEPVLVSGNAKMLSGNARPLTAPPVAAPILDDDDDIVLDIRRDTHTDASSNFLNSVLSFAGGQ